MKSFKVPGFEVCSELLYACVCGCECSDLVTCGRDYCYGDCSNLSNALSCTRFILYRRTASFTSLVRSTSICTVAFV